jgi:hypothetical protein
MCLAVPNMNLDYHTEYQDISQTVDDENYTIKSSAQEQQ